MSSDPVGENDREYMEDAISLDSFAEVMMQKLRENKHKAHWSSVENRWLLGRLGNELGELFDAFLDGNEDDIILECADVANFAMMIADNLQKQKKGQ